MSSGMGPLRKLPSVDEKERIDVLRGPSQNKCSGLFPNLNVPITRFVSPVREPIPLGIVPDTRFCPAMYKQESFVSKISRIGPLYSTQFDVPLT
jgi:hypothetical protein